MKLTGIIVPMALFTLLACSTAMPDTAPADYELSIDATKPGATIPNVVSNINEWALDDGFINPSIRGDYNIFDFVEYVQLMTATGGNPDRDLFKDPSDRTVLDDYDFSKLVNTCRGILSLGAKPHIKFANVPNKLAKASATEAFGVNVFPPEDYHQYYKYIRAIVQSLCDEFGKEELLSWHYGVFTEYENSDWFQAYDHTPESSAEEFCKVYDWTVQALIDVLGTEGLYVGAHSMTVSEGLWDELIFVKHCAEGTNWANGGRGSYINYLSASFYDRKPGEFTQGKDLPHTIAYLKDAAESYGLKNLVYGVDEGRILCATAGRVKNDIYSRTCGFTYMAAYDARLYTQLLDAGGSYFSSWYYLSKSLFEGNPSVSYHVSSNMAHLAGMSRAATDLKAVDAIKDAEIGSVAGVDPATGKTSVMIYNFSNDVAYADTANVRLTVRTTLKAGKHKLTFRKVSDDCNYFDEWVQDRQELGITDDMFRWSPDDACHVASNILDKDARAKYEELEKTKYHELSKLVPETAKVKVSRDGTLSISCPLGGNNVWFIDIE